jgi:SAM-dependent methyltransferase
MKNNVDHVSILNCMVENAKLKPLHYDHIILLNFLEHVEHPVSVLEQLSNSLSPNGFFHITVPLANSLHRHLGVAMGMISDIEEIAESDLHFGHYRVYTPEILNRHIVSAGLAENYKQFFYLKPLPTSNLTPLSMDVHKGLFKMGKIFPEFASYIYVEASVKP